MNLASLARSGRDGRLIIVADDRRTAVLADTGVRTLQAALDDWLVQEPRLRSAAAGLAKSSDAVFDLDEDGLCAPLPRSYQWAESSAYHAHMERMRAARGIELPADRVTSPLAYNSGSDRFLGPREAIPLADEAWGLDLEATIAVVTGDVPQGTPVADAAAHIRLVMLANDLTLRNLLPREMAKGAGLFQSKPARSFAPLAVTPDGLGAAWRGALLHAAVECRVNGELLGRLDASRDCAFDFAEIIAHMATTRSLGAGTIVGSGTVANRDPAAGFGCLGEKRAIEALESGAPRTPYLRAGDHVRIEAFDAGGRSLFGAIDQTVAGPAGDTTTRTREAAA